MQAHRHTQLFGWVSLIIVGVGLFFLPRLRGTTLARIELAPWSLACLLSSVALRAFCQPLIPLGSPFDALGRFGTMISGGFEIVGVALFIAMIVASFRAARPIVGDAPIVPVRPYLALSITSFVVATLLNIPMTLVFAVRNLPLFMRLAAFPKHSLLPIFLLYVGGTVLRLLEQSFFLSLGKILQGGALLIFIWELDVLLRRKLPWTVARTPPPANYIETRPPTRPGYPDYGEYGRFELLILSAFAWLGFACVITVIDGASALVSNPVMFNLDIERHALTMGFITLLIFGMAVRMLPGFSGKRRVASPRLVMATFGLGNLAAIARVVPLLLPDVTGINIALGMSGAMGWLAVACFGINLWRTFRRRPIARQSDSGVSRVESADVCVTRPRGLRIFDKIGRRSQVRMIKTMIVNATLIK